MRAIINDLIEALRNELKEYGEMLALLDEQQEHVMGRHAERVLDSVARINTQAAVLHQVRAMRESLQRDVARSAGVAEDSALSSATPALRATSRCKLSRMART